MASELLEADVHVLLERHHVRYEVRPYFILSERHHSTGPNDGQKIQAGFDVDLYGMIDKMQLPLFHTAEGHQIVDYFHMVAQALQSEVEKHGTRIEVMPCEDSLVLDTHQHLQPEALLRIRVSHIRGLDQPEGPSEELAVNSFRALLHQLKVKEA